MLLTVWGLGSSSTYRHGTRLHLTAHSDTYQQMLTPCITSRPTRINSRVCDKGGRKEPAPSPSILLCRLLPKEVRRVDQRLLRGGLECISQAQHDSAVQSKSLHFEVDGLAKSKSWPPSTISFQKVHSTAAPQQRATVAKTLDGHVQERRGIWQMPRASTGTATVGG